MMSGWLIRDKRERPVNVVLNIHRNHKAYQGWEKGEVVEVVDWLSQCCFTSTETGRRLIRDGNPWRPPRLSHSSWALIGGGGRGRLYTYHYTVTTRMTPACITNDVSLIVRDKVTRQCPQTTTWPLWREKRAGVESNWGHFCLPAALTPYC